MLKVNELIMYKQSICEITEIVRGSDEPLYIIKKLGGTKGYRVSYKKELIPLTAKQAESARILYAK